MADETPNIFQKVVAWFKEAADWVQQNLGDPALAASIRDDLGLRPGADISATDRAKFQAFGNGLDPDKEAFDATVEELTEVIQAFIQLGETLKDPVTGAVAWDVVFLLSRVAAADSVRTRFPAIYALAKLGLLVSDDPDSVELLDPALMVKVLKGETPQDASKKLFTRVSASLSFFPIILDNLLAHFGKPNFVEYFYGWDPSPGSTTPLADAVTGRTLTMLVGPPTARAALTMVGMEESHGGPGLILSLGGLYKDKLTKDDIDAEVSFGGAGALTMFIPFSSALDLRADGNPDVFASLAVTAKGKGGQPAFRIGEVNETRVDFGKIGGGVEIASDRAAVSFRIQDGALVITPGKADGFLKNIISGEIKVAFNLKLKLDSRHGLVIEGGTGLNATIPVEKTILDTLTIHHITLGLGPSTKPGKDLAIETSGAFGVKLGPFQASVDRLGFTLDLAFRQGNLGLVDLDLGFKPPNGIGLMLDASVIKGGGYLFIDAPRGEYAGALELKIDLPSVKIGIKAIGILSTKMPDGSDGWALLLLVYGQFPPIQLSWGFTLTGLGGMIGLQHGANVDALIAGMSTGVLDDILFPANPVADAPRIINRLRVVFPITARALILGPMAELGWGTPNIVTIRMGVIVQIDDLLGSGSKSMSFGRIVILGQVLIQLPPGVDANLTVLKILVDFVGSIELNPFRIGFVARLRDSYAGKAPLKLSIGGMLVVQAVFGDRPSFVLAAGGFHPDFRDAPPGLPAPIERLFASFNISIIKVRFEGYFAVTPASIQAGARAMVSGAVGPVSFDAQIGFDAICYLQPVFRFEVSIHASAAIKFKGHKLAGISFEFLLAGPGRWRIRGYGKFEILFWDIDVPFDESWGEDVAIEAPSVNSQALVAAAVSDPRNWTAQLPLGGEPLVTLADITTSQKVLAHPLGTLVFTQQAVPFDLELQKIGEQRISGPTRFSITNGFVRGGDGVDQPAAANPLSQHFAVGQFRNLTDSQKINDPSFQPFTAGCRFGSDAYSAGPSARDQDMAYETLYLDPEPERPLKRIRFRESLVNHVPFATTERYAAAGAVARSGLYAASRLKGKANAKINVGDAPLATATRDKLSAGSIAFTSAELKSVTLAQDAVRAAGAAVRVQVVEAFELA
jgi:hypothetical protein